MIMGVESIEMSSNANAAKSRIDRGVAGRNMMPSLSSLSPKVCSCQRPQDAAPEVENQFLICEGSIVRGGNAVGFQIKDRMYGRQLR